MSDAAFRLTLPVWTVVDSEVLRRGDPAAAIVTVGGGDRGPIFPLFTRAGAAGARRHPAAHAVPRMHAAATAHKARWLPAAPPRRAP